MFFINIPVIVPDSALPNGSPDPDAPLPDLLALREPDPRSVPKGWIEKGALVPCPPGYRRHSVSLRPDQVAGIEWVDTARCEVITTRGARHLVACSQPQLIHGMSAMMEQIATRQALLAGSGRQGRA